MTKVSWCVGQAPAIYNCFCHRCFFPVFGLYSCRSLSHSVGSAGLSPWDFKRLDFGLSCKLLVVFVASKGSTLSRLFIRGAYTSHAFTGPLEKLWIRPWVTVLPLVTVRDLLVSLNVLIVSAYPVLTGGGIIFAQVSGGRKRCRGDEEWCSRECAWCAGGGCICHIC